MLLLFPTDIETLEREKPYANYVVIGLTVLLFFWSWSAEDSTVVDSMVLTGWNPVGLVGHLCLHGGFMHLLGNMLFLWAFGNVVCRTTSNRMYPWLYLGCGLGAAVTHLIIDGDPAVGASGAVNGMVGIALAMFPFNRVEMRWVFFGRSDTFDIKLWILAGIWFLMDLWGAVRNAGGVAYAAHLGGLITGLGIGFYLLHSGRVLLSVYDNESLYEKLTGRELERLDDEMEKAEPEAAE